MSATKPISLVLKTTIFLFIMILPLNLLALATTRTAYHNAIDNANRMVTYTLNSHMELLNHKINNTNTQLYTLPQNDPNCISLFQQENSWQYTFVRYQFFLTVTNILNTSNIADQMIYYLTIKDDFLSIPYHTKGKTTLSKDFFTPYIENYSTMYSGWFLIYDEDIPYLFRLLYDQPFKVYYGANINLQATINELEKAFLYEDIQISFSDTKPEELDDYFLYTASLDNLSLYLNIYISQRDILGSLGFWQNGILIIFVLYIFLTPVLLLMFRRHVGRPLKSLNIAHHALKQGNEDYRITETAISAEFYHAFASFNDMAYTLQSLRLENISKELANQQLQLEYLQLQIRPHFLLNTFNLIYTMIQNKQEQPAEELILYLSDYFRYMFRQGHQLALFSKELDLIQKYMHISRIYYPNAFTISYQLDPVISLMRIPPLLLHSFFENIIQHAFIPNRMLHIIFYGEYDDGTVIFHISDDGCGMDPLEVESINQLNDSTADKTGKHIGIRNSIKRLKHYFGPQASVQVESGPSAGTTFTIEIPYNLEEDENEFIISE